MKKFEDEVGEWLVASLVIGLILVIALPVAYVIRVMVKTSSPRLLSAILAFILMAALAVLTRSVWLGWIAAVLAVVTLVLARVEEVQTERPEK